MKSSRRRDFCNFQVHRASVAENLGSEKHLQIDMSIPDRSFQEPNVPRRKDNLKFLVQTARKEALNRWQWIKKKLAKKIFNPNFFTDRVLKAGFNNNLDSHHINHHVNSKITITPIYSKFEILYVDENLRELATIYAKLWNHNKLKHQTVFSAKIDKEDKDDQLLDEIDLYNSLNTNQKLTQSDIVKVSSQLEQQNQNQERRDSVWRFDKFMSTTI